MKNTHRTRTAALSTAAIIGAGLLSATAANADVVRARCDYTNVASASIVSPPVTERAGTAKFAWTRTDAPGAGIDSTIAQTFASFCVDIPQPVSKNSVYTFDVLSLAAAGWGEPEALAVRTLWANHIDDVVDTATNSAFQLAVWELRYDTDRQLSAGAFKATSPAASVSLAQTWLDGAGTLDAGRTLPTLAVLSSPTAQDQITVQIPAPGPAACMIMGMALLGNRRRR